MTDRPLSDAVETYSSLLSNALFRQWQVDPVDVVERHWKIASFPWPASPVSTTPTPVPSPRVLSGNFWFTTAISRP